MMKRFLTFLMLGIFIFPMVAEISGSHSFKHALHNVLTSHHADTDHEYSHHHGGKSDLADQEIHDLTMVGVGSLLNDYLHLDILNASKPFKQKSGRSGNSEHQKIAILSSTYHVLPNLYDTQRYVVRSYNDDISQQDLYLRTQRLRI